MENQEELKLIYEFINDFWQLIKATLHCDAESDAYWSDLISTAGALGSQYDHRLPKDLINAYLDYLDRKAKGGKQ
jgi:hypothetical protein